MPAPPLSPPLVVSAAAVAENYSKLPDEIADKLQRLQESVLVSPPNEEGMETALSLAEAIVSFAKRAPRPMHRALLETLPVVVLLQPVLRQEVLDCVLGSSIRMHVGLFQKGGFGGTGPSDTDPPQPPLPTVQRIHRGSEDDITSSGGNGSGIDHDDNEHNSTRGSTPGRDIGEEAAKKVRAGVRHGRLEEHSALLLLKVVYAAFEQKPSVIYTSCAPYIEDPHTRVATILLLGRMVLAYRRHARRISETHAWAALIAVLRTETNHATAAAAMWLLVLLLPHVAGALPEVLIDVLYILKRALLDFPSMQQQQQQQQEQEQEQQRQLRQQSPLLPPQPSSFPPLSQPSPPPSPPSPLPSSSSSQQQQEEQKQHGDEKLSPHDGKNENTTTPVDYLSKTPNGTKKKIVQGRLSPHSLGRDAAAVRQISPYVFGLLRFVYALFPHEMLSFMRVECTVNSQLASALDKQLHWLRFHPALLRSGKGAGRCDTNITAPLQCLGGSRDVVNVCPSTICMPVSSSPSTESKTEASGDSKLLPAILAAPDAVELPATAATETATAAEAASKTTAVAATTASSFSSASSAAETETAAAAVAAPAAATATAATTVTAATTAAAAAAAVPTPDRLSILEPDHLYQSKYPWISLSPEELLSWVDSLSIRATRSSSYSRTQRQALGTAKPGAIPAASQSGPQQQWRHEKSSSAFSLVGSQNDIGSADDPIVSPPRIGRSSVSVSLRGLLPADQVSLPQPASPLRQLPNISRDADTALMLISNELLYERYLREQQEWKLRDIRRRAHAQAVQVKESRILRRQLRAQMRISGDLQAAIAREREHAKRYKQSHKAWSADMRIKVMRQREEYVQVAERNVELQNNVNHLKETISQLQSDLAAASSKLFTLQGMEQLSKKAEGARRDAEQQILSLKASISSIHKHNRLRIDATLEAALDQRDQIIAKLSRKLTESELALNMSRAPRARLQPRAQPLWMQAARAMDGQDGDNTVPNNAEVHDQIGTPRLILRLRKLVAEALRNNAEALSYHEFAAQLTHEFGNTEFARLRHLVQQELEIAASVEPSLYEHTMFLGSKYEGDLGEGTQPQNLPQQGVAEYARPAAPGSKYLGHEKEAAVRHEASDKGSSLTLQVLKERLARTEQLLEKTRHTTKERLLELDRQCLSVRQINVALERRLMRAMQRNESLCLQLQEAKRSSIISEPPTGAAATCTNNVDSASATPRRNGAPTSTAAAGPLLSDSGGSFERRAASFPAMGSPDRGLQRRSFGTSPAPRIFGRHLGAPFPSPMPSPVYRPHGTTSPDHASPVTSDNENNYDPNGQHVDPADLGSRMSDIVFGALRRVSAPQQPQ